MLYLVLVTATLAATGKSVFMKKIGVGSNSAVGFLKQNVISFGIAALIALAAIKFNIIEIINISSFSLLMSVLFAVNVIFTYLTQIKALASGNSSSGMLIYSCGFLIPIIFGAVKYDEKLSALQFLGLVLLAPALFLIISPKREGKFSLSWLIFSLLSMIGSGITAVLQKIHQHSAYRDEFLPLLFLYFAFATLILFVVILILSGKKGLERLKPKDIGVSSANGFFIGILNMLNLRLAGKLPAVIVFPIYNIGSMMLSGIILSLLFKEKNSCKEKLGFALGLSGILLIGIG